MLFMAVLLGSGWQAQAGTPSRPPRLVTGSPALTELVYQLGKSGDLVAVSSHSLYPHGAESLPTIGPLFNPGIEKIIRFRPDWVLVDSAVTGMELERVLQILSVPHLSLSIASV